MVPRYERKSVARLNPGASEFIPPVLLSGSPPADWEDVDVQDFIDCLNGTIAVLSAELESWRNWWSNEAFQPGRAKSVPTALGGVDEDELRTLEA